MAVRPFVFQFNAISEPALSLSKGLNRLLNCDTVTGSASLNGFRLSRADGGDGFLG
ncbi:MAG: hypothetical protein AABZ38_01885 [candidate division NC10 bacterium]